MASPPTKGSKFVEATQLADRQQKEGVRRHRSRLVEFFESDLLNKPFELPDIDAEGMERRAVGWAISGGRGPMPPAAHTDLTLPDQLRFSMSCPSKECDGASRTMILLESPGPLGVSSIPFGASGAVIFSCAHCGGHMSFLVHAKREGDVYSIVKAGRWPNWRPRPDAVLSRALGKNEALYAKGLAAERMGFGVGAYAYYRRVAEDVTGTLMAGLLTFAKGIANTAMVTAIEAVASEQQASKKINAVKDLLPPMLCENGLNPLGTIYGALSDHIHGRTDTECVDLAGDLRGAVEFLLRTLEGQQIEKQRYEASIRKVQASQAERARKAKG